MLRPTQKYYLDTIPFASRGRVLALGMFDGIHIGHLDIIRMAVRLAKTSGIPSCVQTFTGLNKNNAGLLYTVDERISILEQLGVDEVLVLNYPEVCDIRPEDYCRDIMKMRLGARALIMGFDYTFGSGGSGDVKMLESFAKEEKIGIRVISERRLDESPRKVSTTWMREALSEGNVALAREMCAGRPYFYSGYVAHGKRLGISLGFPTANILIPEEKFTVRRGVYAVRVTLGSRILSGVANVGRRPTVEHAETDVVETYIFDFDEDIYGAPMKVELLEFLRPEAAFRDVTELARAVEENKKQALEYFSKNSFI